MTKKIPTLKRKGYSSDEPQKKDHIGESSQAVPIRSVPTLEPAIIALSPALSDEAVPPAPVQQEGVMERKKKKAIGKKVGRKAKNSEGKDLSQEQGSLDDREIIHLLMEGSILPHIVERLH